MVHDMVILGDLVLRGLVAPGSDEGLVQRQLESINANWYRDFHSRNGVEVGLV